MASYAPPVYANGEQGNVVIKMAQPMDFSSPYPQNVTCSACSQQGTEICISLLKSILTKNRITTYTTEVTGSKTKWGMCAFCCGLGILCFWIPLVVRSFKDVEHRCTRCSSFLGTFKPSPKGAKIACGILTALQILFIILYIVIYVVGINHKLRHLLKHSKLRH